MDYYGQDLAHKFEQNAATIKDASPAEKNDLLKLVADLLNDHCPDLQAEYIYGGIDVFQADMTTDDGYAYTRINAKRGADNFRYGSTHENRS
jgi:hypothetical protein